MVTIPVIFAVVTSVALSSASDDVGTMPELLQSNLPQVSKVSVRTNGATSPAVDRQLDSCSSFQLSAQEAQSYIRQASEVSEHDYHHMLDWSPCYASGEVVFEGGLSGVWAIQQYRAGSLKLSNGRHLYLYCPKCRARAFLPK